MRFSVLSLIVVAMGVSQAWAAPAVLDRLEASVNSDIILYSDIQKFKKTLKLRSQIDHVFRESSLAAKGEGASEKDITDFLVDEHLITQAFPVTDSEVEQQVNSIQSNIHADRTKLRSILAEEGFAFEDYFELIRASTAQNNLIDREIRSKVTISDDDVRNYFYNHYAKQSTVPVAYHLGVVAVSLKSFKNTPAAHDAAARALESIRGGEAFEEVARRVSDDASASGGGDLGEMTDDQMSPAMRDQAKKMKVGQVSDIFGGTTAGSFYILKLFSAKTADNDRYAKMEEEIRGQLTATEYEHQISLWLTRQRQKAFIHRAGEPSVAGLPVTHL